MNKINTSPFSYNTLSLVIILIVFCFTYSAVTMGSLAGHVIPGCFFLVHGFVWALLSMWMQLNSRVTNPSKKNKRESSTNPTTASFFEYKRDHGLGRKSWIPLPCCTRVPVEPIIKIVLALIGIIVEAFFDIKKTNVKGDLHLVAEVYHVYTSDGKLNDLAKLHHITMYGAFLLSGIIDIVTIFIKLPRQTSMITFSVAFWVEWMLFYSHSDANDALNKNIHFLLTLVIFSCVVFAALRLLHASHLLINLGLAFSIFLQGTWFIQVGATLYPATGTNVLIESWKSHGEEHDTSHRVTMFVYSLFTWHVILIIISLLVLWVVLSCFMRSTINRRLGKFRSGGMKSSQMQNWIESEENEKLITIDDGGTKEDVGVAIEMHDVAETVP